MSVRPADPPDPACLTVLGTASVGGRVVRFGTVASAPRLWMALEVPTEPSETAGPAGPSDAAEAVESTESTGSAGVAGAGQSAEAGVAVESGLVTGCLLGYVTGLVVGEPDLWVREGAYREWVLDTAHAWELKRAAARVWCSCIEECGG